MLKGILSVSGYLYNEGRLLRCVQLLVGTGIADVKVGAVIKQEGMGQ